MVMSFIYRRGLVQFNVLIIYIIQNVVNHMALAMPVHFPMDIFQGVVKHILRETRTKVRASIQSNKLIKCLFTVSLPFDRMIY